MTRISATQHPAVRRAPRPPGQTEGGPPHGERRLQDTTPATGDVLNSVPTTVVEGADLAHRRGRQLCPDCDTRAALRGWRRCAFCLRAYVDGMHRRRAAEQRLAPLDAR